MADSSLASGLANLAAQDLVRVLDALALVRVGPAEAPDRGRDLAHLLAVGARHGHAVRLGLDLDLDPLGDVIDHRVRVAKGELHLGTLDLGAVTHADDIELLREAGGHAQHRVRDQGPQQAVLGALRTGLAGTLDRDHAILDLDRVAFEQRLRHLAPRAFGDERPILNLYLGPAGHRDRHFSNARHLLSLLPELAEDLAADLALARLDVGQQTLRRRDDPHAEAVAHRLDLAGTAVDPAARLADPLHAVDRGLALCAVAQEDAHRIRRAIDFDLPVVADEALLLEETADLQLEPGDRHVEPVVLRQMGVADPRQQVRDGIGHAH